MKTQQPKVDIYFVKGRKLKVGDECPTCVFLSFSSIGKLLYRVNSFALVCDKHEHVFDAMDLAL
jgi:hypothetical protein